MQVNGTEIHLEAPISLQNFLTQQGYSMHQIAVERNGAIVPRATYAAVTLQDDDHLEVVRFVGGG